MKPLRPGPPRRAFTLIELLVSVAILGVIVVLFAGIFSIAASIVTKGQNSMEADSQARSVFDRMKIDLAQSIRRPDLDFFLKQPAAPQNGNDQIAFFCETPGYAATGYSGVTQTSPSSLVAYRVNTSTANNRMELERMGKGLVWNGIPTSGNVFALVYLPSTIQATWPTATNSSPDTDYELVGPQVFRFEYAYVLKGNDTNPSILSDTPWDTRLNHNAVEGLQDVSALHIWIAVVDPRSRVLLSADNLNTLAGTMTDFTPGLSPDALTAQWQSALDSSSFPQEAVSSIAIYSRTFPLTH